MDGGSRPTGADAPSAVQPTEEAPGGGDGRATSRRLLLQAVAVAVAALVATVVLLGPRALGVPVTYGGDSFQHFLLADTADWTGTPGVETHSGAPAGTDWSSFPVGGERLQLVALAGLRAIGGGPFEAVNLYLLLGVTLTAVLSFLVLRWMGVSPLVAGAGALVFALAPATYARVFYGLVFLFALFPVPLAVFLACRASGWRPPGAPADGGVGAPVTLRGGWTRGELVAAAGAAVVVGLSSSYYAVFAILLIVGLGVLVAVRRAEPAALVAPVLAGAAVGLALLATKVPDLLRDAPAAAISRPLSHADRYGLRPAQMLLPSPDHPIPALAAIGERAGRVFGAADFGVSVGLVATVGLGVAGWVCLRRSGRPRDRADSLVFRLGGLAGLTMVFAVAGGAGYLLSMAGLRDVRAWSRMAVFAGFCGVAAVAVVVDRRARTSSRVRMAVVLVGVLALLEQRGAVTTRSEVDAMLAEDRQVVGQMARSLPRGTSVLELPAVSFPDDFGSERLLALPVVAAQDDVDLSFSAGAFRGGPDDWQQSLQLDGAVPQVAAATAAGFGAVALQRTHHLWGDALRVERELTAALGEPAGHSDDGTWTWWSTAALREEMVGRFGEAAVQAAGRAATRPVGVSVEGTPGFPSTGSERDALVGRGSAIVLRRFDGDRSPVVVRAKVRAAEGATVVVTVDGHRTEMRPGPAGRDLSVEVPMRSAVQRVGIRVEGAPLEETAEYGTSYAEILGLQVLDSSLEGSEVIAPSGVGG